MQVEEILSNVVLVDSPDNKLRTSDVYKAIRNNSATVVFSERVFSWRESWNLGIIALSFLFSK